MHEKAPDAVAFEVVVAPTEQLISVAELRTHLRLPSFGSADTEEDGYLSALIATVGGAIETHVRRAIRPQTRTLVIENARGSIFGGAYSGNYLSWWGGIGDDRIILNATPIRAVTSISYDRNGENFVLPATDYKVLGLGEHITRRVEIIPENKWPDADCDSQVEIVVECGFTAGNIPEEIKHAAKIMAGSLYNFRDEYVVGTSVAQVPRSAQFLLNQFVRVV